jgi:CubicO group peptidase (beta-lactamase class C family)
LVGIWLGTLQAAGTSLRLQLHLDTSRQPASCTLDSLDQGVAGLVCDHVVLTVDELSLEVPVVHGSLRATVSPDGQKLDATWTQGGPALAFALVKRDAPLEPERPPPPVALADLDRVLAADLAPVLAQGELDVANGEGAVIGVVSHGERRVLAYGAVAPDAVFEIGSITKTFTGLVLAQLAAQHRVRLDEPVRALLPAGTVAAPSAGAEITLLDLSAQRSGLPRMPDNFHPADDSNPYADYDARALYAYLAGHGVALPAKPEFAYSNLGVGLLGHALALRAHSTYEALVAAEITTPLGMHDTVITLTPALRARLAPGHDAEHNPAPPWDLVALAGAGALRSTAADMVTYLEAQLHPDQLPVAASASEPGKTLAEAIAQSHELRGEAGPGKHIALGWMRGDQRGRFFHDGGTGGYTSFAVFDPTRDFGVIVLVNASTTFANLLAAHVVQRLSGEVAVSLTPQ